MDSQEGAWHRGSTRRPGARRLLRRPAHRRKSRFSLAPSERSTHHRPNRGRSRPNPPQKVGARSAGSEHRRPRHRLDQKGTRHDRRHGLWRASTGISALLLGAAVVAVVVVVLTGSVPLTPGRGIEEVATTTGSMPAPPGYSHKVFEDSFRRSRLNKRKWDSDITSKAANGQPWNSDGSGGSGINPGGYNAEYFRPSHLSVHDGLTLTAVRGSTRSGYAWTSGVVSTYGKFQFDGGYVQIKAKMPAGDGMWPGLWLLPGPGGRGGDNFELDIFEGNYIGNGANPNDNDAWHLHTVSATQGGVTNVGSSLAGGYHIYGINWIPGQSITWYLDGKPVGILTSAQTPIPNEPMELIMDLQVASGTAAGWITTTDASTPSPSTMEIAEVQVYRSRADRQAAK